MRQVYLDYNASTPIAPEVRQVMLPLLENDFGNPSAMHQFGRNAKRAVEQARTQMADLIGANPEELIFTSGGTESNNHALKGVYDHYKDQGNHIITTSIEHPAVIEPCRYLSQQGAKITYVSVDEYGRVDPDEIEQAITEDTILISVMHSNNEVGTIQPIKEIGKLAKERGILFHTDASQSLGKLEIDVDDLHVDLLTFAGHKLYAPKGIGALYIREGVKLSNFMHGAGHERGLRAGTENVIFAAALGEACRLAKVNLHQNEEIKQLRDYFWGELKEYFQEKISLNGHPDHRLPNTLNINMIGRIGQEVLAQLSQVAASTGSACHAGEVTLSPVLSEMGVSEEEGMGAIRFSLGKYTIKEEIDYVLEHMKRI
ncbi:cysteine desulfurase family protein [Alkalihalophilus pseudofirmus]|uniref:cysteine desulfurase family protein n=1 Tax=Alkalihalophilus pseudofirmus TaxID=79885 RepID=UPI00259BA5C3|nr:cysteine desulfurase family protein [Alkalihalophilus pseudofirmus]WEG18783.1 cysteine desulfurase family protein [Alkalihalophilus pseudofirmus]